MKRIPGNQFRSGGTPLPEQPAAWGGLAIVSLILCVLLSRQPIGNEQTAGYALVTRAAGQQEKRKLHAGTTRGSTPVSLPFQRISKKDDSITAEYGFRNFNNDSLRIGFTLRTADLSAYLQGFGYEPAEVAALEQKQKKSLEEVHRYAVKNRLSQEQLNRMAEEIKADYRSSVRSFFASRGLVQLQGNVLAADVPEISRRSVPQLRCVAQELHRNGQLFGYDSDSLIAAALSLVQTALRYEEIPAAENGRVTGGVLPPLETMARGKGDCDTKAALLASILLNWDQVRMVGVGTPNHYLMGILRNPAKGDAYIEYKGLRYVLMEPAGPGWLPMGAVASATEALLNSGNGIRVYPITARP